MNRCVTCLRMKHQTFQRMMRDVPYDKIVPSRPFEKTGIDLVGPIITKFNLKRLIKLLNPTLQFLFVLLPNPPI